MNVLVEKTKLLFTELEDLLRQLQTEEEASYFLLEELLSKIPGVTLVKKEYRENGVLVAGVIEIQSSVETRLAIGINKNLASFRFLSDNQAEIYNSCSSHQPVTDKGSWSEILIKLTREAVKNSSRSDLLNIRKAAAAILEVIDQVN